MLIDSATSLDIINLREERLILKYIVKDNSDLDKLTGAKENIVLCPIFLDEKNITLQPQMVITKDEVLKINQNLKRLLFERLHKYIILWSYNNQL